MENKENVMERIDIELVTKTPVGIIEKADKSNIYIKKLTVCIEGKLRRAALIPGNGINGKLRRIMTGIVLENALPKGIELSDMDFNLINSGGGAGKQKKVDEKKAPADAQEDGQQKQGKTKPETKTAKKKPSAKIIKDLIAIRNLNPVVSIFGAGLTIPGKIAINNFIPADDMIKDNIAKFSENYDITEPSYVQEMSISHMDDLLTATSDVLKVFTEEELQAYQDKVAQSKIDGKSQTQMLITKQYIVPGITFYSSIMQLPDRQAIKEYEYGLLLKSLERLAAARVGSTQKSWGVVNYNMQSGDAGTFIESKSDDKYAYSVKVVTNYTKPQIRAIAAADEWLNNISAENINIAKYFDTAVSEEDTAVAGATEE